MLVAIAVLVLWLWPRRTPREVGRNRPVPTVPVASAAPVEAEAGDPSAVRPGVERRLLTIEDFPDLATAPPNCKQIVLWHRRNAPAWTIEKNMDAQAMMFDDEEMACLNEKGVPDQILDRAENHRRVPQPTIQR